MSTVATYTRAPLGDTETIAIIGVPIMFSSKLGFAFTHATDGKRIWMYDHKRYNSLRSAKARLERDGWKEVKE